MKRQGKNNIFLFNFINILLNFSFVCEGEMGEKLGRSKISDIKYSSSLDPVELSRS